MSFSGMLNEQFPLSPPSPRSNRRIIAALAFSETKSSEGVLPSTYEISKVIMSGSSNKAKIDRNLREKHRRSYIKELFARLASILPARASRASVFDLIEEAIDHIRQSRDRIMMLSRRLEQLSSKRDDDLPKISVTSFGNELEVNMRISESNGIINLVEIIHAIEEEGAEPISLSYSIVGGRLLGTIQSKAISARIGIEISNVKERLRQLSFRYNQWLQKTANDTSNNVKIYDASHTPLDPISEEPKEQSGE